MPKYMHRLDNVEITGVGENPVIHALMGFVAQLKQDRTGHFLTVQTTEDEKEFESAQVAQRVLTDVINDLEKIMGLRR